MVARSFRRRHLELLKRRIPGIREVLTHFDPYRNWAQNRSPHHSVRGDIAIALFLLVAKHTGPETSGLLERTIEIADRALNEKKCESRLCRDSYPANRGEVVRLKAYARALLGFPLDTDALKQASVDLEAYCTTIGKGNWDEISQPIFLSAIRMALITRNNSRAEAVSLPRQCTGRQQREQVLWHDLIAVVKVQEMPIRDKRLLDKFQSVFDRARNPSNAEEIAALEMGIIKELYFVNPQGKIDWQRVIDSIGE